MSSDAIVMFVVGCGSGVFVTNLFLWLAFNRDKSEFLRHCNDLRAKVRQLTEDRYRLERERDGLCRELEAAQSRLAKIGEYLSGLEGRDE